MPPAQAVRRSFEELPDATQSTVALRQPNFDGYAGRFSAALNICDICADRAALAATDLIDIGNQSGDFKFPVERAPESPNEHGSTGDVTANHEVGPGASEHRGARHLRLAKDIWYTPAVCRDPKALGLRALVSWRCSDYWRRNVG
jgi:hypothetical protein